MISDILREKVKSDKYFLPVLILSVFIVGILLGYLLAYTLILQDCVKLLGVENLTCILQSQAVDLSNYSEFPLNLTGS